MVIDLVLPDEVGPFIATLGLAKGTVSPPPNRGTLLAVFDLPLTDGYYFYIVFRIVLDKTGNISKNWPSLPFFLLRTTTTDQ